MAIGPVEFNGMIGRTQDLSILKHNEDAKGMIDQSNLSNRFDHKLQDHLETVRDGDDAEFYNAKFDAKEKGKNPYQGDGGKKRKKKEAEKDGSFSQVRPGGFDVKI